MKHNGYEYRYQAARGLERRKTYSSYWESVSGKVLESMTSEDLRVCADAMDEAERTKRHGGGDE